MTLLERWAKAEPERVRAVGEGLAVHAGPNSWDHSLFVRDLNDPHLLGFIVVAIEARGWDFTLERRPQSMSDDSMREYAALVWDSTESAHWAYRGLAADALLHAYLDAVEGEG